MLRSKLPTREDQLFAAVLAALLILTAALAFAYDFIPLLDWPEHCSAAAVTAHLHDPKWGVGNYYDSPAWFQPYHVFRWIQAALGALFGLVGLRAALLVPLWGLPLLALVFCRLRGHDRWSALAMFTVVLEANVLWGFLPYVTAILFMLVGLALLDSWIDQPRDWKLFALAAVAILVFFTHPVPVVLLCVSCGAVALVAAIRKRLSIPGVFAVAGALMPAFALLLLFLGSAPAGEGLSSPLFSWTEIKTSLGNAGLLSGLTLLSRWPLWCFLLAAIALVTGWIWELRRGVRELRTAPRPSGAVVLLALWVALCILLPGYWKGESVGNRIFSLAVIGALLAIPFTGAASPARWPVRAAVTAAALAALIAAHVSFHGYDRANRPLRHAIDLIPMGARVAALPYHYYHDDYSLPTALHFGGYVHAQRGGYASFNFGHVPYKEPFAQYELSRSIWIIAYSYQLPPKLTDFYDYVIVRTGDRYPGNPFAPRPPGKKAPLRIFAEGDYELWETLN